MNVRTTGIRRTGDSALLLHIEMRVAQKPNTHYLTYLSSNKGLFKMHINQDKDLSKRYQIIPIGE